MKIVHIINSLEVGGAERSLERLVTNSKKFEHVVISLRISGPIKDDLENRGITVYCINFTIKSSVQNFIRLIRIIRNEKPILVQTWLYHANLIGGFAARLSGVKKVVWCIRTTHLPKGAFATSILRAVSVPISFFIPAKIVYVAERSAIYHSKIGFDNRKGTIISNGIPMDMLIPKSEVEIKFRKSHYKKVYVVGFVGRDSNDKGVDIFLNSCLKISEVIDNTMFLMVGRGLIPNNKAIDEFLIKNKIKDKFILKGQVPDVTPYLRFMDIFCLTSRTEGFPNILAEAMLLGIPSVSTDVGDAEVISSGLVPICAINDSTTIANEVIKIMRLPEASKKELSKSLSQHISRNYSINMMVNKFENLYEAIIKKAC